MESKEAQEIKNILTGLLISSPLRLTVRQLWNDFKEVEGRPVPYQSLGFGSFDDYLRSIPDTVIVNGTGPLAEVEGIITSRSGHINEMVLRQKKSIKPRKRNAPRFNVGLSRKTSTGHNVHNSKSTSHFKSPENLPSLLTLNVGLPSESHNIPKSNSVSHNLQSSTALTVMASCPEPPTEPENKLKSSVQKLPTTFKENTQESQEVSISGLQNKSDTQTVGKKFVSPQVQRTLMELNQSKVIQDYGRKDLAKQEVGMRWSQSNCTQCDGRENLTKQKTKLEVKSEDFSFVSDGDYLSRIPIKVQANLRNLIEQFPNGLECIKLPEEYGKRYKKKIYYLEYGYKYLIEMCSDLPKIFHYLQHSSDDYMLYDARRPLPSIEPKKHSDTNIEVAKVSKTHVLEELPKLDWNMVELLPPDVVTINDQISRFFPPNIVEDDILDVTIGEIYDLSKFWMYMTYEGLEPLMQNLQVFFSDPSVCRSHLIPESLLQEGLYCVALYYGQYHRCVIVSMWEWSPDFVRVLFVDYGTVNSVKNNEIWFLPKQFSTLPCQAIRARLSGIYPKYDNKPWSAASIARFESLIVNRVMVAKVIKVHKKNNFLEIYLADITNMDNIFYINDIFVKEGYAVYTHQEQKKTLIDYDCLPNVKYIHLYPEFYEIESGMAPTTEEMQYIIKNKVPLHHYLPQYFDIYFNDDIEDIQKYHEKCYKKQITIKLDPTLDLQEECDFSCFPNSLADELRELYEQEERSKTPKPNTLIKSDQNTDGESTKEESLKEYKCNKKRISELMHGRTPDSDSSTTNFLSSYRSLSELSNISDQTQEMPTVLRNFENINLSTSESRRSTNPFLNGCLQTNESSPFRMTNPFLNDVEEKIDTSGLVDLFAKPKEALPQKIVNNLKDSHSCICRTNKQMNIDRSAFSNSRTMKTATASPLEKNENECKTVERVTPRVRTPPGFSSQQIPSLQPNPHNFVSFVYNNNPYYQRFPFPPISDNISLPLNQTSMPLQYPFVNNYFNPWPATYGNQNYGNWEQRFPNNGNYYSPHFP